MRRINADELLRNVGNRIAELRAERELTQEELALTLGFQTARYVQRVEAGKENLSLRSLADIASALNTSVPSLLEKPRPREVRKGRPPKKKTTK